MLSYDFMTFVVLNNDIQQLEKQSPYKGTRTQFKNEMISGGRLPKGKYSWTQYENTENGWKGHILSDSEAVQRYVLVTYNSYTANLQSQV